MKRVLLIMACMSMTVAGCGVVDNVPTATAPDPVQEFLHFIPAASSNSNTQSDVERLVDQFTNHLEDYGNRTPGTITSKPINGNDGVYEIEWKVNDPQSNTNYDFQFKYLEKAGHIDGINSDANLFIGMMVGQ